MDTAAPDPAAPAGPAPARSTRGSPPAPAPGPPAAFPDPFSGPATPRPTSPSAATASRPNRRNSLTFSTLTPNRRPHPRHRLPNLTHRQHHPRRHHPRLINPHLTPLTHPTHLRLHLSNHRLLVLHRQLEVSHQLIQLPLPTQPLRLNLLSLQPLLRHPRRSPLQRHLPPRQHPAALPLAPAPTRRHRSHLQPTGPARHGPHRASLNRPYGPEQGKPPASHAIAPPSLRLVPLTGRRGVGEGRGGRFWWGWVW